MIHLCPICNKPLIQDDEIIIISSPTITENSFGSRIYYNKNLAETEEQIMHYTCFSEIAEGLNKLIFSKIIEIKLSKLPDNLAKDLHSILTEELDQKCSVEEIERFVAKNQLLVKGENVLETLIIEWCKSKKKTID